MTTETNKTVYQTSTFVDEDKNTILHYAAARGNLEELIKQTENGCKIDCVNFLGWSPLMMATRNGHFEVVQYLIEQRADSTKENKFGFNILLMAVASGKLKVIHLILQHLLCGGISRQSLQKIFSPISIAVLFGYKHVVEYLIQHSFCVNAVSVRTDSTPMDFANSLGNTELRQLLISKGAKISNSQTNNYQKQLMRKPHMPELPPLILVPSPQIISPLPSNMLVEMPRRCSDLNTPFFTPHVSPFPSNQFVPQVFFPPSFSPNHFVPPVPYPGQPYNDFLNVRLVQSNYCSPVTSVFVSPY